jgi:hypothetical protein
MSAIVFEARVTADHELHFTLPDQVPPGSLVKVTVETVEPVQDAILSHYEPRTEVGRRLLEARRAYIESGGKLMNWDEVDEEVRRRRGGVTDE